MDISKLLEVEVKEGKASEMPSNGEIEAYANIPDFSLRDIASVRFRKLHCTACDVHIGSAPSSAHNMHEHPVLHVLLCTACRNFYGDGTFEQGDDATDMFCRWCANGGNLYCCSYCSNTFCYNCIKRNFDAVVRKKIERDEKWKCFVCNPADLYTARAACWALLQHVQTVTRILQSDRKMSPKEIEAKMNLDESQCCPHRNKRKRSETMDSEDEDQEEEIQAASQRKKRRRYLSSKRKKRAIKMENDGSCDAGSLESTNNSRMGADDGYSSVGGQRQNEDGANEEGKRVSPEELPLAVRQKSRRLHSESRILPKFPLNDDDIPASLLQPDQTMVEGVESLSFPNTSSVPSAGISEQPRNVGISAVPMVNLMKRPLPPTGPLMRGGKTHRLVRGVGGTPVLVRKIAPAITHNLNSNMQSHALPMVTIPSLNHMRNRVSVIQAATTNNQEASNVRPIRPRPLVPRPLSVTLPASSNSTTPNFPSVAPSVIDLDSDGDDPIVVLAPAAQEIQPSDNLASDDRVRNLSTVTYPVRPDDGLMMIHSATPLNEDENENEDLHDGKTFAELIREPYSVDPILDELTLKFKKIMESTVSGPLENELIAARAKTRSVSRTIKRTIVELQNLNERLLRAYRNYKRERTKENIIHTESIVLEGKQKTREFTPLDMQCTRESEPESDDSNVSDDEEPSTDSPETPLRIIEARQRSVHRAVDATIPTKSQSVQAYDVESRDYDAEISYALLLKAEYDPKRKRDILRPVAVPDEHFGKYEEQFIHYLQHIEDHGIETEESRASDPKKNTDDVSINQLIDADLSAILNEITKECSTDCDITKDTTAVEENVEILEEHLEIFTTKSDASEDSNFSLEIRHNVGERNNISKNKEYSVNDEKAIENIPSRQTSCSANGEQETGSCPPSIIPEETTELVSKTNTSGELRTKKVDSQSIDEETVLAVRALIDENGKKANILNPWKPIESDDECTILD
ncbi:transcriptional regulator ATRX [Venturia canescens]|uniref:transcriptional regulator ATRX n=1 Tax=Venturia canescens TaxID=32260 RepID=UPI001C9CB03B|nr:transcriptional regulator ATRX [Venturia canescens]XP_043284487.1 transcriptional regulator ATRX [Venturia canescens]XP_043284495.1 transcriptional regulator ATRX [Venturia canescens]